MRGLRSQIMCLLALFLMNSAADAAAPGAPTIGSATAGNAVIRVTFTAPNSNGGVTITGYTASCGGTGLTTKTATGTASPLIVTDLTNGKTYSCTVTATNGTTGTASSAVTAVPVSTGAVPGIPTMGSVVSGSSQATVSFTAPSWTGGLTITGYTATCYDKTGVTLKSTTGTSTSLTVTGLTNGTQYFCSVYATNSKGSGTNSATLPVTPLSASVPGAPTIGTATAGNAQLSVSFTAPSSTGGSAILYYTATCGAKTAVGTSSPIVVTGLTNGTTYTCSVKATNSIGSSAASSSTASKTPSASNLTVSVTANYKSATVYFSYLSAASYYTATCGSKSASGTYSPLLVRELTNGTSTTCTVKAYSTSTSTTAITYGTGTTSSSFTPSSSNPVAPYIYAVLPGDSRVSIMFNFLGGKVLSADGLSSPSSATYSAICRSSDNASIVTSTNSLEYSSGSSSNSMGNYANPLVVSGLTNGKTYSCTVTSTVGTATAVSNASVGFIPNAGPVDSSNILASGPNIDHISSYPNLTTSYCAYTNQTATGTGYVPLIAYGSLTTPSYASSSASLTCSGTSTRTLSGNGLPDHRSSEWFASGYSGYTGSPYFSGCPNYMTTGTVTKTVPYSGTISTSYSKGSNTYGYDTSACYTPGDTLGTTYPATGTYRCKTLERPLISLNSVKVEPGTAETYSSAGDGVTYKVVGKNLYQDVGLDPSNGHNQPTDVLPNYHYHGIPEGHLARVGKGNSQMTLIGFAADGFPVYARYGYTNPTSTSGGVRVMKSNYRLKTNAEITSQRIAKQSLAPMGSFEQDWVYDASSGGDLDACNGRYAVTPESPNTPIYHYYMTDTYPFIQRCVFGQNPSNL